MMIERPENKVDNIVEEAEKSIKLAENFVSFFNKLAETDGQLEAAAKAKNELFFRGIVAQINIIAEQLSGSVTSLSGLKKNEKGSGMQAELDDLIAKLEEKAIIFNDMELSIREWWEKHAKSPLVQDGEE